MKWKAKTVTNPNFARSIFLVRRSILHSFLAVVIFASGPNLLPVSSADPAPKKLKPSDPYALIFGTVWGPDDHAVYGVKVNIRRARDKKSRWGIYSDHAGEFAQRVPAGKADYIVGADLKGIKTKDGQPLHLAQEVSIHVEYDERVDTSLHLTR